MTYFNTTNLTGKDLGDAIRQAERQEDAVMAVMESGIARSPSQLQRMFAALGRNWPIQSIRRAVTDCTTDGRLVKLSETRRGPWNAKEHLWQKAGAQ